MYSRLERLMRLAQKTGDTLIVHDKEDRDVVIMDVTHYEVLHDMSRMSFGEDDCLHDMDESQLIDKINRDIAIWRSHQEDNYVEDLQHELEDEPPFDPFEEDFISKNDWHSAGTVLEHSYPEFGGEDFEEDDEDVFFNWDEENDEDEEGMIYDELGEDEVFSEKVQPHNDKQEIPYVSQSEVESGDGESLDDEPVFFEEPV